MITWLNVQEAAGMLAAMGLVLAGLFRVLPRSLVRYLASGILRTERDAA